MIRLPHFTVMVCATATALLMLGHGKSPAADPFPGDYEKAFTEEMEFTLRVSQTAEILNTDLQYFDGGTAGVVITLRQHGRAFVMIPAKAPGQDHRNSPQLIISAFEGLIPQMDVAKGSELAKRLRLYFKTAKRPSDPQVLKRIQAIEKVLLELSPPSEAGDKDASPIGKALERLK